jgi:hypothetical protein
MCGHYALLRVPVAIASVFMPLGSEGGRLPGGGHSFIIGHDVSLAPLRPCFPSRWIDIDDFFHSHTSRKRSIVSVSFFFFPPIILTVSHGCRGCLMVQYMGNIDNMGVSLPFWGSTSITVEFFRVSFFFCAPLMYVRTCLPSLGTNPVLQVGIPLPDNVVRVATSELWGVLSALLGSRAAAAPAIGRLCCGNIGMLQVLSCRGRCRCIMDGFLYKLSMGFWTCLCRSRGWTHSFTAVVAARASNPKEPRTSGTYSVHTW